MHSNWSLFGVGGVNMEKASGSGAIAHRLCHNWLFISAAQPSSKFVCSEVIGIDKQKLDSSGLLFNKNLKIVSLLFSEQGCVK